MNIRDLSLIERLPSLLVELIAACKPGTPVHTKCPELASDSWRKSAALKVSLDRLLPALGEAGPPPKFAREKPPLYLRVGEPEIREIASLLGHYGRHEDEFYALTKRLAGDLGNERVSDAMRELTWIDVEKRWVRLRPETLRSLRPWIGPFPGDPDLEHWWRDKGGPPEPRSPDDPRPVRKEEEAKTPARKKSQGPTKRGRKGAAKEG